MTCKVLLVDLVGDVVGHYKMMQTLSTLENTIIIDTEERKISLRKHPLTALRERYRMLKNVMRKAEAFSDENIILHFLTGDKFYILPLFTKLTSERRKVVVNIHSYPRSFLQKILLRNFAKRITAFVVCSECALPKFKSMDIRNVVSIPWPSFYEYALIGSKDQLKERYGLADNIILTFLGGLRHEKGLDILLDAFQYLPTSLISAIVLNIAGKPSVDTDLKKIREKISLYKIKTRLLLRTLTDEEFCENVVISDMMVLPYRKTFKGTASGPLVEALSQGIPCVFPQELPLGYYAKYNIGETFEQENPRSLAKAIQTQLEKGCIKYKVEENNYTIESYLYNNQMLYQSLF